MEAKVFDQYGDCEDCSEAKDIAEASSTRFFGDYILPYDGWDEFEDLDI